MTISIDRLEDEDLFDAEDLILVNSLKALACSPRDKWSHDDFKPAYAKIKSLLLTKQNKFCFYCQRQYLHVDMDNWHIDHIVPIDEDDRFTFCDRNFVLACKGCNRRKNDKPVLVSKPKRPNYSKSSANYRIVHPRLDRYSHHIDVVAETLYMGKTPKGRRTVFDCVLDRFSLEFFSNIDSSNRDFVEGAMALLLSSDPKKLISFVKSM